MILIFYNRNTKECIKRFINPLNDSEYYEQIKQESDLLNGFELLDISIFWTHINIK